MLSFDLKQRLNHLLFVSAIMLAVPLASQAQDPITIAASATVGVELANASGAVDDILEKSADEANYVVFNAASQMRLLIESFRISTRDVLDQAFNNLDNTQQLAFSNIQRTIITLEGALDQPIEDARQSVEAVHQIINEGLPWLQESAVLRSSPSVIASSTLTEIPFTFRGLSLDIANPRLMFGDVEAKRIGLERQQAIFTVPSKIFQPDAEFPRYVSGVLEMFVEKCSWIVFCDTEINRSEVAVLVLPQSLATVEISRNTRNEERVYADRTFRRVFGYSTGDLTRMRCEKESQGPHDPEYFIDLDTLRSASYQTSCPYPARGFLSSLSRQFCPNGVFTKAGVTGKARNRWGIVDKNPAGFTVELCAQSQIKNLKKKSGEIFVNLTWKEFRKADVIGQFIPEESKILNWGSPIQTVLPDDTYAITVKLRYFDGSEAIADGPFSDKFVDISWNNATKQLIISPKSPNSIDGVN